jgi:hypothetical protein
MRLAGWLLVAAGTLLNEWTIDALFNPIGLAPPELAVLIRVFDVLCLASGLVLIRWGRWWRRRELAFLGLLLAASLAAFLALLEGGVRLSVWAKNLIVPRDRDFSSILGWETKPHVRSERVIAGYGRVRYTTATHGFRAFGDVASRKTKLLVVGDSITQAYTVSDGEAYFDHLARGGVELFVYGCGGYGTLQEYLIVDRYVDEIRPDVLLWQFSGNDIINNDHALESASTLDNNQMTRPYLEDGAIVHRYPTQHRGPLAFVVQHSTLLRLLNIRLGFLRGRARDAIEFTLGRDDPHFRRAVETTSRIMAMVRRRVGRIPVVAFSGDVGPDIYGEALRAIALRHGFVYVDGVAEAIEAARAAGTVVDGAPDDTHWNRRGHEIAGAILRDRLIRSGLIAPAR